MFNKFKTWFTEGNKKSMEKIQNIHEKNNNKVDRYIEEFLNSTGIAKGLAKGKLLGTNRVSRTYPQYKVDYIGGHYEAPEGKDDIEVIVLQQGLFLSDFMDLVPYEEIKDVQFKTESEIQSDVTLTRMIAFGVHALAMKKKKKVVINYLILDCEKNGMKYSMAFGGDNVASLYKEVFKSVSKVASI